MLYYLIAFILGYLINIMMRGNSFRVGGQFGEVVGVGALITEWELTSKDRKNTECLKGCNSLTPQKVKKLSTEVEKRKIYCDTHDCAANPNSIICTGCTTNDQMKNDIISNCFSWCPGSRCTNSRTQTDSEGFGLPREKWTDGVGNLCGEDKLACDNEACSGDIF